MIAGLDTPDMGTLTVGETVDVMYVDQNREGLDDPELSVFDVVAEGADEIDLGPRTVKRRGYGVAGGVDRDIHELYRGGGRWGDGPMDTFFFFFLSFCLFGPFWAFLGVFVWFLFCFVFCVLLSFFFLSVCNVSYSDFCVFVLLCCAFVFLCCVC